MQTSHQKRIESFMRKAKQELPGSPTVPSREVLQLRAKLILEEALETIHALGCTAYSDVDGVPVYFGQDESNSLDIEGATQPPNLAEIADGCADISVVTIGTLSACGIQDKALLEETDRNNLAKFGPGHVIREDGKLVKPPGHRPPDIERVLRGQGYDDND